MPRVSAPGKSASRPRQGRGRILAAFLALLTIFLGRIAAAEPPKSVAVLAVEISGTGAPELRRQLERSIRAGLVAASAEVVGLDDVSEKLAATPELVGCTSTTCLERIAEIIAAESFLRATVEARGADYRLRFELLAPSADEGVLARAEESCSICTIVELNDVASRLAAGLVTGKSTSVEIEIVTQPLGARVTIDGEDVGVAPFRGLVTEGTHRIVATQPGRAIADKTVEVSAEGDESTRRFELILPADGIVAVDTAPARPYRRWKWVAAGGAAASLLTGIVLVAIDGDPTCGAAAPEQCPSLRDTMAGGVLSIGLGVGLGAASGWMFVRDRDDRGELEATSTRGPPGLSWTF